jgi:hypothetical protein
MNRSALPQHWSPEQAIAVYEFLQQLSEQLWDQYRADFIGLLGEPAAAVIRPSKPAAAFDQYQLRFSFDALDDPAHGHDLPF